MKRAVIIVALLAIPSPGFSGESMLEYFKGRLPATTPPAATDTMPIMQGGGAAMRMIPPADLSVGKVASSRNGAVVVMQRGTTEAATANKLEVRDAAGNLTMVITATGAMRFFNTP